MSFILVQLRQDEAQRGESEWDRIPGVQLHGKQRGTFERKGQHSAENGREEVVRLWRRKPLRCSSNEVCYQR